MSYNFKSIADVEVVEKLSSNAHTLIEENGIIKKVANNQGEYDAILYWEWIDGSPDYGSLILEFGTYNAILSKLQNWEMPKILIKHHTEYGERSIGCFIPYNIVYEADDDLNPMGCISIASNGQGTPRRPMPSWFWINSDNSVKCSNY